MCFDMKTFLYSPRDMMCLSGVRCLWLLLCFRHYRRCSSFEGISASVGSGGLAIVFHDYPLIYILLMFGHALTSLRVPTCSVKDALRFQMLSFTKVGTFSERSKLSGMFLRQDLITGYHYFSAMNTLTHTPHITQFNGIRSICLFSIIGPKIE